MRIFICIFIFFSTILYAETYNYECEYSSRLVQEGHSYIKANTPFKYLFLDLNAGKTLQDRENGKEYVCNQDNLKLKINCENTKEDIRTFKRDYISIGISNLDFHRNVITGKHINNNETKEVLTEYRGKCKII